MKLCALIVRNDGAVSVDGKNLTPLNPSHVETAHYDGRDPFFINAGVCGNRNEIDPPDGLLLCTQCRLVQYCSPECQKKHFRFHKNICKQVQKARQDTVHYKGSIDACTAKGDEANKKAKTDYACAIAEYADVLKLVALQHNNKMVLEMTLHAYLDVMGLLAYGNNRPLDALLPFWFLFLNRDNDAYSYCKYWILATDKSRSKEVGALLKDGNKIYPEEENSRYRDIFQDCPMKEIPLYYLLVLFLIKLHLVGKL